jgi:hypothetical protein
MFSSLIIKASLQLPRVAWHIQGVSQDPDHPGYWQPAYRFRERVEHFEGFICIYG